MHVHGHGNAVDLAHELKSALDFMGQKASSRTEPPSSPIHKPAPQSSLDTEKIARIVGRKGEQSGSVYKITIGRDDLSVKEMGAAINARMGLNTWAAFVGTNDQAAIAGDVAMLEREVNPVLQALLRHNLTVVAIHHHMISVRPVAIFLHYWGQGRAEDLATGFRAALDELGKGGPLDSGRIEQGFARPWVAGTRRLAALCMHLAGSPGYRDSSTESAPR